MPKFYQHCSCHPARHEHDNPIAWGNFVTTIVPPVAPGERKPREHEPVFYNLAPPHIQARHKTRGGKGVVGRL